MYRRHKDGDMSRIFNAPFKSPLGRSSVPTENPSHPIRSPLDKSLKARRDLNIPYKSPLPKPNRTKTTTLTSGQGEHRSEGLHHEDVKLNENVTEDGDDNRRASDNREVIDNRAVSDNREVTDDRAVSDNKELGDNRAVSDCTIPEQSTPIRTPVSHGRAVKRKLASPFTPPTQCGPARKRQATPFKCPALRLQVSEGASGGQREGTEESLREEISRLEMSLRDTDSQIQQLEDAGYSEGELEVCIEALHRYNEMKDVGQMILGRVAQIEGCTTKDLYGEMNLDLDD